MTPRGREILGSLTLRERAVAVMIAGGMMNKHVAGHLGIGEQTVKNYCRKIFDKSGVDSRLQFGLLCAQHGVFEDGLEVTLKEGYGDGRGSGVGWPFES
jgi:DNA-binding NarL/FixJ family response regulator